MYIYTYICIYVYTQWIHKFIYKHILIQYIYIQTTLCSSGDETPPNEGHDKFEGHKRDPTLSKSALVFATSQDTPSNSPTFPMYESKGAYIHEYIYESKEAYA